jgi:exocyst complex component 2
MDGKYRKVGHFGLDLAAYSLTIQRDSSGSVMASTRPSAQCRSMTLDIVKLYNSTLSQFFTLSDVAISEVSYKKEGDDIPLPSFVPHGTSVITACYFGERLVEDVAECANELGAVDVGNEATSGLRGMMSSLRWRFEEAITATWSRGVSASERADARC